MHSPSPRITVVVPTRNAERFLVRCLESVFAQTHEAFEILVCDDQSDDGTRALVQKLAQGDSRIRTVFHDRRQGISRNFNSGLAQARGDFVTLVAGDDFWGPRKLAQEIEALAATGRSWAYSKVAMSDADGRKLIPANNTAGHLEGEVLEAVLLRELAPRSPLIARDLLARVGRFDPSFAVFEDWDLRIRLAAAAPIAHAPGIEVVYRLHPQGSSRSRLALRLEMALAVLRRHRGLVRSLGPEFVRRLHEQQCRWFQQRFEEELARGAIASPDQTLDCRTLLLGLARELAPTPPAAPGAVRREAPAITPS